MREPTDPFGQPFQLLDFVGLGERALRSANGEQRMTCRSDTTSYIAEGWREKAAANPGMISEDLVRPIPMLEDLVKQGKLGRKTGQGFFNVSCDA